MTKLRVHILIGLMALALVSIIILQLVWMNNAMKVRNELFDRSVKEALIETSRNMETMTDVFWLRQRDIVDQSIKHRPFYHQILPPPARFYNKNNKTISDSVAPGSKNMKPVIKNFQNNVWISTNGDTLNTGKNIRIEIVEMDSMISTMEKKIDRDITLMYTNTANEIEIDSMAYHKIGELQNRIVKRADRLKNTAGKLIVESWIMNHDHQPDTSIVNHFLKSELLKRDIPIPFEFGVFYNQNNLIKTSNADSLFLATTQYQTKLYPGSIIDRNEQLSIYFPGRKLFVFKTLVGPALLSLLLSAFIMGIFGLSIFYILNQKKISEMKSDFINNMTHEFKTPLATISVAADSIINRKVITNEEKVKHFVQVIKKENIRMNQQVETILQIARLDKKDFEFNFRVVDIHELLDMAVQAISLQVESRKGTVTVIKEALNTSVTTDPAHTLNLLNNLLDNANKYSPETPAIEIYTRNSERGVWISVTDNGIGMSKQVQQKIFEKFYRETSGNIHNVKGFGLGLSYAKAVVDANKGEIKVTSEPGKGSTFSVFVPFTMG